MSKYIDKDKVLEYIIFGVVGKDITCGELARGIESLPTIEVSEGYTEFIEWLAEVVLDDKDWELNAIAYGEVIARKLKKLGLLEVEDGYYVRASVTPTERTGEWIIEKDSYEIICSRCKCEAFSEYGTWFLSDYCPYCGAKMKGEK